MYWHVAKKSHKKKISNTSQSKKEAERGEMEIREREKERERERGGVDVKEEERKRDNCEDGFSEYWGWTIKIRIILMFIKIKFVTKTNSVMSWKGNFIGCSPLLMS